MRTQGNLLPPAPSVPAVQPPTVLQLVSFIPCPSLVDFITSLPPAEGNATILTIIDRFSKVVHFVPLIKLHSSLETGHLLVNHVVHVHDIPQNIVSDRDPQFNSQVWKGSVSHLIIICRLMARRSGLIRTWNLTYSTLCGLPSPRLLVQPPTVG